MIVPAAAPVITCSTSLTVMRKPPSTASMRTSSSPGPVLMTSRPFTSMTVNVPLPMRSTDESWVSSTRPSPSVSATWKARPTSPTQPARWRPMA